MQAFIEDLFDRQVPDMAVCFMHQSVAHALSAMKPRELRKVDPERVATECQTAREAIVELMGICQSSPSPPVTTILRAHKADDGLLSFSEDGYSLNFEFHPKRYNEDDSRKAIDRILDETNFVNQP